MESYLTDLLTRKTLPTARGRRQPAAGPICHSERGSQYTSRAFALLLNRAEILPSMSRRGSA